MNALRIHGGRRLTGEWRVHSAKNAVLPIMAASILTGEETRLEECPELVDVAYMADILRTLGCRIHSGDGALTIDPQSLNRHEMPDALAKKIRSSIFLLGSILARFRKATVTFPGGCEIGLRPIDLHLSGLRQLGVDVREEGGLIRCDGRHMRAATVHFDYPSVGATENVMMAAVLLPGTTVIHNPAREPEIADLQAFINAMGGKIRGAGTHYIAVEGVERLHGTAWTPMADRIVAGTLLAAAAITGGEITLTNAPESDMVAVTAKLREMGCRLEERPGWIHLRAPKRLTAFAQLQTQPHPGPPTDTPVQMLALLSTAEGMGVITENVFENRFTHAGDLNRMGAHILCTGRTAVVRGVPELYGAHVTARDLRGGAALVLAGLRARGETLVDHAELIDRGYDHLERQLSRLGGRVRRVSAVPGEA